MDQATGIEMVELLPSGLNGEDRGTAGGSAGTAGGRTAVDKPSIKKVKYNSLTECIRGLGLKAKDEDLNQVVTAQEGLKACTLTIESYLKGEVRLTERQLVKVVRESNGKISQFLTTLDNVITNIKEKNENISEGDTNELKLQVNSCIDEKSQFFQVLNTREEFLELLRSTHPTLIDQHVEVFSFHRQFLDKDQNLESPGGDDSFVFEDQNFEWDYTESDMLNQFGLLDLNNTGNDKTTLVPPTPESTLGKKVRIIGQENEIKIIREDADTNFISKDPMKFRHEPSPHTTLVDRMGGFEKLSSANEGAETELSKGAKIEIFDKRFGSNTYKSLLGEDFYGPSHINQLKSDTEFSLPIEADCTKIRDPTLSSCMFALSSCSERLQDFLLVLKGRLHEAKSLKSPNQNSSLIYRSLREEYANLLKDVDEVITTVLAKGKSSSTLESMKNLVLQEKSKCRRALNELGPKFELSMTSHSDNKIFELSAKSLPKNVKIEGYENPSFFCFVSNFIEIIKENPVAKSIYMPIIYTCLSAKNEKIINAVKITENPSSYFDLFSLLIERFQSIPVALQNILTEIGTIGCLETPITVGDFQRELKKSQKFQNVFNTVSSWIKIIYTFNKSEHVPNDLLQGPHSTSLLGALKRSFVPQKLAPILMSLNRRSPDEQFAILVNIFKTHHDSLQAYCNSCVSQVVFSRTQNPSPFKENTRRGKADFPVNSISGTIQNYDFSNSEEFNYKLGALFNILIKDGINVDPKQIPIEIKNAPASEILIEKGIVPNLAQVLASLMTIPCKICIEYILNNKHLINKGRLFLVPHFQTAYKNGKGGYFRRGVHSCPQFLSLDALERLEVVKKFECCMRCLNFKKDGHVCNPKSDFVCKNDDQKGALICECSPCNDVVNWKRSNFSAYINKHINQRGVQILGNGGRKEKSTQPASCNNIQINDEQKVMSPLKHPNLEEMSKRINLDVSHQNLQARFGIVNIQGEGNTSANFIFDLGASVGTVSSNKLDIFHNTVINQKAQMKVASGQLSNHTELVLGLPLREDSKYLAANFLKVNSNFEYIPEICITELGDLLYKDYLKRCKKQGSKIEFFRKDFPSILPAVKPDGLLSLRECYFEIVAQVDRNLLVKNIFRSSQKLVLLGPIDEKYIKINEILCNDRVPPHQVFTNFQCETKLGPKWTKLLGYSAKLVDMPTINLNCLLYSVFHKNEPANKRFPFSINDISTMLRTYCTENFNSLIALQNRVNSLRLGETINDTSIQRLFLKEGKFIELKVQNASEYNEFCTNWPFFKEQLELFALSQIVDQKIRVWMEPTRGDPEFLEYGNEGSKIVDIYLDLQSKHYSAIEKLNSTSWVKVGGKNNHFRMEKNDFPALISKRTNSSKTTVRTTTPDPNKRLWTPKANLSWVEPKKELNQTTKTYDKPKTLSCNRKLIEKEQLERLKKSAEKLKQKNYDDSHSRILDYVVTQEQKPNEKKDGKIENTNQARSAGASHLKNPNLPNSNDHSKQAKPSKLNGGKVQNPPYNKSLTTKPQMKQKIRKFHGPNVTPQPVVWGKGGVINKSSPSINGLARRTFIPAQAKEDSNKPKDDIITIGEDDSDEDVPRTKKVIKQNLISNHTNNTTRCVDEEHEIAKSIENKSNEPKTPKIAEATDELNKSIIEPAKNCPKKPQNVQFFEGGLGSLMIDLEILIKIHSNKIHNERQNFFNKMEKFLKIEKDSPLSLTIMRLKVKHEALERTSKKLREVLKNEEALEIHFNGKFKCPDNKSFFLLPEEESMRVLERLRGKISTHFSNGDIICEQPLLFGIELFQIKDKASFDTINAELMNKRICGTEFIDSIELQHKQPNQINCTRDRITLGVVEVHSIETTTGPSGQEEVIELNTEKGVQSLKAFAHLLDINQRPKTTLLIIRVSPTEEFLDEILRIKSNFLKSNPSSLQFMPEEDHLILAITANSPDQQQVPTLLKLIHFLQTLRISSNNLNLVQGQGSISLEVRDWKPQHRILEILQANQMNLKKVFVPLVMNRGDVTWTGLCDMKHIGKIQLKKTGGLSGGTICRINQSPEDEEVLASINGIKERDVLPPSIETLGKFAKNHSGVGEPGVLDGKAIAIGRMVLCLLQDDQWVYHDLRRWSEKSQEEFENLTKTFTSITKMEKCMLCDLQVNDDPLKHLMRNHDFRLKKLLIEDSFIENYDECLSRNECDPEEKWRELETMIMNQDQQWEKVKRLKDYLKSVTKVGRLRKSLGVLSINPSFSIGLEDKSRSYDLEVYSLRNIALETINDEVVSKATNQKMSSGELLKRMSFEVNKLPDGILDGHLDGTYPSTEDKAGSNISKEDISRILHDFTYSDFCRVSTCTSCPKCFRCKPLVDLTASEVLERKLADENPTLQGSVKIAKRLNITKDSEEPLLKIVCRIPLDPQRSHLLGDNEGLVKKEFDAKFKKLSPQDREEFDNAFQDLVKREVFMKLDDAPAEVKSAVANADKLHFLALAPQWKTNSLSTKLRCAINASKRNANGVSLNDLTLTGKNNLDLPKVFRMFRYFPHAVCADIKKFFNNVYLELESIPLQMLIYREGCKIDGRWERYIILRLMYGIRSSTFLSAEALNLIISFHSLFCKCQKRENRPQEVGGIQTEELLKIKNDIDQFTRDDVPLLPEAEGCKGPFHYFKAYASNIFVDDMNFSFPEDIRDWVIRITDYCLNMFGFYVKAHNKTLQTLDPANPTLDETGSMGISGYDFWPHEDLISTRKVEFTNGIKIRGLLRKMKGSKSFFHEVIDSPEKANATFIRKLFEDSDTKINLRLCVSRASTIFDPSGYLTPLQSQMRKLLSQLIIASKADWNFLIPDDALELFYAFMAEYAKASFFKYPRNPIPREHLKEPIRALSLLWTFDASPSGSLMNKYYLQYLMQNGARFSNLIHSNTHLSPPKLSVPCCESATGSIGATTFSKIYRELDHHLNKVYVANDSLCALLWLISDPVKLKVFAKNRCQNIEKALKQVDPSKYDKDLPSYRAEYGWQNIFFWVSGEANSCADLGTKYKVWLDNPGGKIIMASQVKAESEHFRGPWWFPKSKIPELQRDGGCKSAAEILSLKEGEDSILLEIGPEELSSGMKEKDILAHKEKIRIVDEGISTEMQACSVEKRNKADRSEEVARASLSMDGIRVDYPTNPQRWENKGIWQVAKILLAVFCAKRKFMKKGKTSTISNIKTPPGMSFLLPCDDELRTLGRVIELNNGRPEETRPNQLHLSQIFEDLQTFKELCKEVDTFLIARSNLEVQEFGDERNLTRFFWKQGSFVTCKQNRVAGPLDWELERTMGKLGIALERIPLLGESPLARICFNTSHTYSKLSIANKLENPPHFGFPTTHLNYQKNFRIISNGGEILRRWINQCIPCKYRTKRLKHGHLASLTPAPLDWEDPWKSIYQVDLIPIVKLRPEGKPTRSHSMFQVALIVAVDRLSRFTMVEVIRDRSIVEVYRGLRAMFAKHGSPKILMSDQESSIVSIARKARWPSIQNGFVLSGTEELIHLFSPATAGGHSFNGLIEQRINSIKKIIHGTDFSQRNVDLLGLTQILADLTQQINSIPISVKQMGMKEPMQALSDCLTPMMIFKGLRLLPLEESGMEEKTNFVLNERRKLVQELLTSFIIVHFGDARNSKKKQSMREDFDEGDIVAFSPLGEGPVIGQKEKMKLGRILKLTDHTARGPRSAIILFHSLTEGPLGNHKVRAYATKRKISDLIKILSDGTTTEMHLAREVNLWDLHSNGGYLTLDKKELSHCINSVNSKTEESHHVKVVAQVSKLETPLLENDQPTQRMGGSPRQKGANPLTLIGFLLSLILLTSGQDIPGTGWRFIDRGPLVKAVTCSETRNKRFFDLINIPSCNRGEFEAYEVGGNLEVTLLHRPTTVNLRGMICRVRIVIAAAPCYKPKNIEKIVGQTEFVSAFIEISDEFQLLSAEQCMKAHSDGNIKFSLGSSNVMAENLTRGENYFERFLHGSRMGGISDGGSCETTSGRVYVNSTMPQGYIGSKVIKAKVQVYLGIEEALLDVKSKILYTDMGESVNIPSLQSAGLSSTLPLVRDSKELLIFPQTVSEGSNCLRFVDTPSVMNASRFISKETGMKDFFEIRVNNTHGENLKIAIQQKGEDGKCNQPSLQNCKSSQYPDLVICLGSVRGEIDKSSLTIEEYFFEKGSSSVNFLQRNIDTSISNILLKLCSDTLSTMRKISRQFQRLGEFLDQDFGNSSSYLPQLVGEVGILNKCKRNLYRATTFKVNGAIHCCAELPALNSDGNMIFIQPLTRLVKPNCSLINCDRSSPIYLVDNSTAVRQTKLGLQTNNLNLSSLDPKFGLEVFKILDNSEVQQSDGGISKMLEFRTPQSILGFIESKMRDQILFLGDKTLDSNSWNTALEKSVSPWLLNFLLNTQVGRIIFYFVIVWNLYILSYGLLNLVFSLIGILRITPKNDLTFLGCMLGFFSRVDLALNPLNSWRRNQKALSRESNLTMLQIKNSMCELGQEIHHIKIAVSKIRAALVNQESRICQSQTGHIGSRYSTEETSLLEDVQMSNYNLGIITENKDLP